MLVPKLRFKEFKNEWKTYNLKDILEIKNGLNKEKESFGIGTPIINYMDVNKNEILTADKIKGLVKLSTKEIENFKVNKGDIFFTRTSETSDEIGLSASLIESIENCVFSGFILKATPKKNIFNNFFSGYYFRTYKLRKEIIKHSSITTRALTSGSLLYSMNINIPEICEQEKIGKTLYLLDKKIELQQRKIEALKIYKKGLMNKLFDNAKLTKKIKDICKIEKGKQLNKENMLSNGKYYVLNGGSELSGYTDTYNVEANTISISEGGNSCGFVNYNSENFWAGGHCYILKDIDDKINVKYLYQTLKYYQKDIMMLRVGSGLPNIQKASLESFEIKVHNHEEQIKAVNILYNFDNKINYEEKQQSELNKLKKGLLQKMFI